MPLSPTAAHRRRSLLAQIDGIVLEPLRMRNISASKAAVVAGKSLHEIMDLTRQHDVTWTNYADDELEADVHQAATLGKAAREQGA